MYAIQFLNFRITTTCRKSFVIFCKSNNINNNLLLQTMSKNTENSEATNTDISTVDNKIFRPFLHPYIEVLGSGAKGAPTCAVLYARNLYLINCGEGTLKLAGEYKIKVHKSVNTFITYPSWKNVSGLTALALAIQDVKGAQMFIHGDASITNVFSAVTKFVKLRKLNVNLNKCNHYEEFTDDSVNVKYVLINPTSVINPDENASDSALDTPKAHASSDNDCEYESDVEKSCKIPHDYSNLHLSRKNEQEGKHKRKRTQSENCAQTRQKIHKKFDKCATCFIFTTHPSSGALSLEKCMEFGVPPGPLLGKLKKGFDVTLDDGTIVRSQDVKNPDKPGVSFIAVECPTEDYLESLLEEPIFNNYQSDENPASLVVHFTPSQVLKTSRYKNWINSFSKKTRHLFINEDNNQATSVAIHRQQLKLNFLQPELFPLLHKPDIPQFPRKSNSSTPLGHVELSLNVSSEKMPISMDRVFYKCDKNNFIQAETMCRVFLKHNTECDYYKCLVLNEKEFLNEIFEEDGAKEIIEKYKSNLREAEEKINLNNNIYPKIVFLGTGSSKPSKTRSQSAILIYTEKNKCIMFDCGEYTYGQLMNFYGEEKTKNVLLNLHAIYISHMHADHHLGLITLLIKRKNFFDECQKKSLGKTIKPVFVFAPKEIYRWLTLFSDIFEDISGLYELIPNNVMMLGSIDSSVKAILCKKLLNLRSIETVFVEHCTNSFGVSIVHEDGWKITYSGDTKPCQSLVELGKGSNILIHEATFEDAFVKEALAKAHSTTKQAIAIGKKMKAENILLTHFSQKYANLPKIEDAVSSVNIGVAFDFMEVPFNKLPLLKEVISPLQYIFPKHYVKNEKRTTSYLKNSVLWNVVESLKRRSQDENEIPAKIVKSSA